MFGIRGINNVEAKIIIVFVRGVVKIITTCGGVGKRFLARLITM